MSANKNMLGSSDSVNSIKKWIELCIENIKNNKFSPFLLLRETGKE